jgi:hypothetical protein
MMQPDEAGPKECGGRRPEERRGDGREAEPTESPERGEAAANDEPEERRRRAFQSEAIEPQSGVLH